MPGQEPELHGAGVSRFGEIGSHPAEVDAAESHTRQVDGPGSSGNTGTGSHLAATDTAEGKTVHARRNGDRHMATEASGVSRLVGPDI